MKFLMAALSLLPTLTFAASLTVGTYNIRNFDYDERYRIRTNKSELAKIINETKADLIAVQEINNAVEFERYAEATFPEFEAELTECGGAHDQKVGFLFNTKKLNLLSFNQDLALTNPGGRDTCDQGSRPAGVALFEIIETKQKFYALSVHLKSGSQGDSLRKRVKQFAIIQKLVQDLQATGVKDFVVAGDMNTTTYNVRGEDYKVLKGVATALEATDLSSGLACTAYWWGNSDDGIETPSILDHVLISKGLIKKEVKTQLGGHCKAVSCKEISERELGESYANVSDHCPVTATIQ